MIPEVRCSVLKRAISDFKRGPGWLTSKSDHRRRTCVVRGLNRDQVVEILRLLCSENLICKRKEFILDTHEYTDDFSPRNIVKRGICYGNVRSIMRSVVKNITK